MHLINEDIRGSEVFLIEQQKSLSKQEALGVAEAEELDLVEFSFRDGVSYCKILNFEKYEYEQHRRERKQKAGNKPAKQKTIEIGYKIAEHDLDVHVTHANEWLAKGMTVVFVVRFRGRQVAFLKDAGPALVERFLGKVSVGYKVVSAPAARGSMYSVTLRGV